MRFITLTQNRFDQEEPKKIAIRVDYITRVFTYLDTSYASTTDGANTNVTESFDDIMSMIEESQEIHGV